MRVSCGVTMLLAANVRVDPSIAASRIDQFREPAIHSGNRNGTRSLRQHSNIVVVGVHSRFACVGNVSRGHVGVGQPDDAL